MSNVAPIERAPHPHATIEAAGHCPECRAYNIEAERDGPYAFVLRFLDDGAIAVIRSWIPDDPLLTAWATGCNTGGRVAVTEIPVEVLSGIRTPLFELTAGDGKGLA